MPEFKYFQVCDESVTKKGDPNILVLFCLAVFMVYIAFHTPELQLILEMSDEEIAETEFKSSQAVFFCFGASAMLLTLYYLLEYINHILTIFITLVCGFACGTVIMEFSINAKKVKRIFETDNHLRSYNIPLIGIVTLLEVVSNILGLTIAGSWYMSRNWVLNNMLGCSMCFLFMKSMRLNKLVPGVLLLSLLFFYDIFWVFGSTKFTQGG